MRECECDGHECGVFYWTCGCCDVGGYDYEPGAPITQAEVDYFDQHHPALGTAGDDDASSQ